MKRTTLLLTMFTAAMVMALVMVAMAVPVFADGQDDKEDNDNESANGGATRNGQIVLRYAQKLWIEILTSTRCTFLL